MYLRFDIAMSDFKKTATKDLLKNGLGVVLNE